MRRSELRTEMPIKILLSGPLLVPCAEYGSSTHSEGEDIVVSM